MMWLLPAGAVLIVALPLLLALRRLAAEAIELRREMNRFSELRPALIELRSDAQVLRQGFAVRARQIPRR